jgi:hypothetical protein
MKPHRVLTVPLLVLTVCLAPGTSRADDSPQAPAKPDGAAAADQRALVEKLFGPEIWNVKDHTDFDQEPQWRTALQVVAKLDAKLLDEHPPESLNAKYDEILKDPAAFRGRFVRLRGVVGHVGALKLDEKIDGRDEAYRGQASGPDGEQRVIFDILDRPPAVRRALDEVEIDGVFYRTVRFETKKGTVAEVPWIVARKIVVLARPTAPPPAEEPSGKSPAVPGPAPKPDAAKVAAEDAKARAILAKAAELQHAGDLAEPGKLESFHVVFMKAAFERTTTKGGYESTQLAETDRDGLVFDWMKGSLKTQVTFDGRTTTKAWYEPLAIGWIHDGEHVASLTGAKYKSDYDQLQFHRTVVAQLLDLAILGKLLRDKSTWRVVADPASPPNTVEIERVPAADAKGAVALKLWVANPSEGVYGDVVAAWMPPASDGGPAVFYDFRYHETFPTVRVKTGDAEPAVASLRFPFVVDVYEQRPGSAEKTKVLEVYAGTVDVNTLTDADFAQPKSK